MEQIQRLAEADFVRVSLSKEAALAIQSLENIEEYLVNLKGNNITEVHKTLIDPLRVIIQNNIGEEVYFTIAE